ncbi:MAG: GDYXXLXY domain-containing protein [Leptolyngbyaceae cyanobacterium SM1_1_3]|nr:GDYXXLXY domain-containing protein [Leptolyngbyaceae cyanobacterium SM1_1_3]NJN02294.1 GDYXXLXY domain-containing protein [Leptolyngbyaceae cyanobacterium RM1_1_2]NJO11497.1 GDYXXLXY domain-containing protein [Leptolyngbyaceae cyanobacterium SL_1_1]
MNRTPLTRPARWQFWVPLLLQLALVLLIPAQAILIQTTGNHLVLQTAPVDPYDLFRGYYVTLSYDISQPRTLETLDGWDTFLAEQKAPAESGPLPQKAAFYVTLQAPLDQTEPPQPWQPVAISRDRPAQLSPNQVALKGTATPAPSSGPRSRWIYGLERYYIPEAQRQEIDARIRAVQGEQAGQFLVEVSINGQGQAVPIQLWIQGKVYRF